MATRSMQTLPRRGGWTLIPPTITLAFQRVRQAWGLLLITGVGIVAAVTLACVVPLYSQVAMTAGLRGVLGSYAQNGDIVVRSAAGVISPSIVQQTTQHLNSEFQSRLGTYLGPSQFSLQSQNFSILTRKGNGPPQSTGDNIGLIGAQMDSATPHIRLLQGRLPGATSSYNDINIAIRPETANQLNWTVGTVIPVSLSYYDQNQELVARNLTLHIVGIFTLASSDDPYWHGEDFLGSSPDVNFFFASALASNQALFSILGSASNSTNPSGRIYQRPPTLIWYYRLDTSRIKIDDLDSIIHGIQRVQVDNANDTRLEQPPFLEQTQTYLPSDMLDSYRSRVSVALLPVVSLLLLMLGLVLFFVAMMVDLLVERQTDALAVLRSRGASRRQIFGALVTQSVGLGLIALVLGPLLAIFVTHLLAQGTLPAADRGALNIIAGDPVQVALGLGRFALLAVGITIIVATFAALGATSRDVVAMRREMARSTRRPLWQRLNLDLLAALIALVGFAFSLYLTSSGVLTTQLSLLLLSPLSLLQAVFLTLAGLLLLLRFFPLLLQAGAWLATRRRGAPPVLALAQMARSPRQAARMTLLLALASAFAIFTLVFTATQSQRILDVAAYQAGADFSGNVPVAVITPQQMKSATSTYLHLPGVTSATLGFTKHATAGGAVLKIPIDFKAVDADTYAKTITWNAQDSSQSLPSLMEQLSAQRSLAIARKVIPAIVDTNTWNTLRLSLGAHFALNFSLVDYSDLSNFQVIAQVQHIPTPGDSSIPGVLVDYQSFVGVYTNNFTSGSGFAVPLNYVWLRTTDDPSLLGGLRKTLSQGNLRLEPLYDRRATIATLNHEPLYLTLSGMLLLGATVALLLAMVGNLIASWLSARNRLINFAALRALGATPRQVAIVLIWEQGIIYATAIVLGIIFGALLSVLALPALVFTSVLPNQATGSISSAEFYAAQTVPALQIVIPASLGIALGMLVAISIVALVMMMAVVSRPSVSQTLRLDED